MVSDQCQQIFKVSELEVGERIVFNCYILSKGKFLMNWIFKKLPNLTRAGNNLAQTQPET